MTDASGQRGDPMSLRKKEALVGMALVLPFLGGFLMFYIIPFGITAFYSFTAGISGMYFAGIRNYVEVFGSHAFQLAAYNTFRFMAAGIPLIMVISLVLSLMLYGRTGHTRAFQSIFLYPMVIPIGSVVMFFQVMFSRYGVANRILYQLGLPEPDWLESGSAFGVLLFLYIWKNCGYNIVLFLTGLNGIPREFLEDARLNGAGKWQYFRYIQCPLLMPSFLFVFVMSVINSFKCFREAYLLGGQYPHESIYMLQHFMNNNFASLNYQRLSVAAILVFFIIFALVILLFSWNYYQEQDMAGMLKKKSLPTRRTKIRGGRPAAQPRETMEYREYREYRGMLLNGPDEKIRRTGGGRGQERRRRR